MFPRKTTLLACLIGLSVHGLSGQQREILGQDYSPSYNAPAAVAVSHKLTQKWLAEESFFADASFTYWYLSEEGLEIATNGVLNGSTLYYSTKTSSYFPSFNYEPGFKVGIGSIHANEWVSKAEYTWTHAHVGSSGLHSASGGTLPAGSTTTTAGTSVFVVNDWFLQGSSSGQALAASSISSHWTLNMNTLDLTAGRPWYQGKSLILSAMGGLELAFISQEMKISLTEAAGQLTSLPSQPIDSRNHSNSWGIGLITGGECLRLLPWDFYINGKGSLALLYTTYTSIKHSEDIASTAFNPGPYKTSYKNYHAVRPSASLDLGLGWARYFCNNSCYLDLSLSYQFSIYWAQNMMRKLLDDTLVGISAAPADLFTQGLTLTAAIHF